MDAKLSMMKPIPTNKILAILPIHSGRYISLQTMCVCKWWVNKNGIATSLQSSINHNKAILSFPQWKGYCLQSSPIPIPQRDNHPWQTKSKQEMGGGGGALRGRDALRRWAAEVAQWEAMLQQAGMLSNGGTQENELQRRHNKRQHYNQLVRWEAASRREDEWQRRCNEKWCNHQLGQTRGKWQWEMEAAHQEAATCWEDELQRQEAKWHCYNQPARWVVVVHQENGWQRQCNKKQHNNQPGQTMGKQEVGDGSGTSRRRDTPRGWVAEATVGLLAPSQRYSTIKKEEASWLWPEKKWLLEKVKEGVVLVPKRKLWAKD